MTLPHRFAWVFAVFAACTHGRALPVAPKPPDSPPVDLAALRARIERRARAASPGDAALVVALEIEGHTIVVARGEAGAHDPHPPDADTLFSLGSITKVLTGVLLADEVERGRVRLDEPAQDFFPDVPLPTRDDRAITLLDLATHRSGLPVMPTNWIEVGKGEYTTEMFHAFLSSYALPFTPGTKVAYGNVGYAVLGDALARRESTTYRALLESRVLSPLGMHETFFLADEPAGIRWAQGHDEDGAVVPRRRDRPRMPACCASISTANDVLHLVDATLHPKNDAVGAAIERSLVAHGQGDGSYDDVQMALGWLLSIPDGVAAKNGTMKGFSSTIAIDRTQRAGVVVLAASDLDASALAFGVLRDLERVRNADPPPTTKTIPADARAIDVDFDDALRLAAFRAPAVVHRGERVTIDLWFRCEAKIDRDWRIFVHGDADGARHRLHADHYPPLAFDACAPGAIVHDAFPLEIPVDYDAPAFVLNVGLYDGAKRMPILPDHGDGHDRARIATLSVSSP